MQSTTESDIRIGYARCSPLGQELDSQLDALAAKNIPWDKIFAEKSAPGCASAPSSRPRWPPPGRSRRTLHCRVILTVHEMKRLGLDAAELTALADHLSAHGLVLEMLVGPLSGTYDPSGHGRLLFAFFAAMAETERENIRESTLEGLDTAARKGKHGGRPPVITDDMLHTVRRRRANGESVEQIQPDLIIPTGKRKGQHPSVASIYRALAEHAKRQAYPEAVRQAHTEFALMDKPGRLIYLSRSMHRGGSTDLRRLTDSTASYSDSKLWVTTLALALASRWAGTTSHAVDPGWVPTRMGGAGAPDDLTASHQTQVWLATHHDVTPSTGGYWYHQQTQAPHPAAQDEEFQARLIQVLESQTGIPLGRPPPLERAPEWRGTRRSASSSTWDGMFLTWSLRKGSGSGRGERPTKRLLAPGVAVRVRRPGDAWRAR
ncbi:recombinase family protein [Streptomyces sp. NPDC001795]|uniref:recombinase family protein n=1 Tax=Streptomyces sp. NPDC001795 TaxID=3154525 RepID=UPI00332C8213